MFRKCRMCNVCNMCVEEKIEICNILRHYWKKDLSSKAAVEKMCVVEGLSVIHRNTEQFESGISTMGIWALQMNPKDNDVLLECANQDPYQTTHCSRSF